MRGGAGRGAGARGERACPGPWFQVAAPQRRAARVRAPVARQAEPEHSRRVTGPGNRPGGARGGPCVPGRWSARAPEPPRPWPSPPLASAAWAGTSARSRYCLGGAERAGPGRRLRGSRRVGGDPGAGTIRPSRGRTSRRTSREPARRHLPRPPHLPHLPHLPTAHRTRPRSVLKLPPPAPPSGKRGPPSPAAGSRGLAVGKCPGAVGDAAGSRARARRPPSDRPPKVSS